MNVIDRKILIVDDTSNWRVTLETLLKSYGYAVTVAANVLEASAALERGPYDAAILDVRLDDFDDDNREGLATVLVSARRKFPHMSFIVISSYYNEIEVRSFVPPGVRWFYFKNLKNMWRRPPLRCSSKTARRKKRNLSLRKKSRLLLTNLSRV